MCTWRQFNPQREPRVPWRPQSGGVAGPGFTWGLRTTRPNDCGKPVISISPLLPGTSQQAHSLRERTALAMQTQLLDKSPIEPPKHTQSTLTALHPTFCLAWFLVCGRLHCFSSLLKKSPHWSSASLPSVLSQCPLLPLIKGSPVFSLYIFDICSGGLSGDTSYLPRYQMFFLLVLCLQSCIKFEQSAPTHFFSHMLCYYLS